MSAAPSTSAPQATTPLPPAGSPWPRRFALLAAASAVPLFAFGGSVTSLEAGMAVQGWLVAEGHWLPLFPVEKWTRDPETFVEHTHRLFGMLVGLFAVLTVVAAWRADARRGARRLALGALLAVCGQGALGGFRVLEDSPRLAFLHGAFGQAVFALLFLTAAFLGLAYARAGAPRTREDGPGLRRLALVAVVVVYAQVVVGAMYRHGLRPTPGPGSDLLLGAHLLGALAVFGVLAGLIAKLRAGDDPLLTRAAGRLQVLLFVQVALGFAAWTAFRPGGTGGAELLFSVAHVVVGALLLAQTSVAGLWVRRRVASTDPAPLTAQAEGAL